MAKRGRPTNKVVAKRKYTKSKSELYLLVAVLFLVVVGVAAYFLLLK